MYVQYSILFHCCMYNTVRILHNYSYIYCTYKYESKGFYSMYVSYVVGWLGS